MKKVDIIIIVLVIAVFVFMGYVVYFMLSEGGQCLKHPLNYYKEKQGEDMRCFCFPESMFSENKTD